MSVTQHKTFSGINVGFLLLGLLVAGCALFSRDGRETTGPMVMNDEYFKYGSIGAEDTIGVPYWIWKVLPEVCGLLGGYESLGFLWEKDGSGKQQELPIGFARKDVTRRGIPYRAVGPNCALCHTATYRARTEEEPHQVLAGPSSRFDLQGYVNFLTQCADNPNFTGGAIRAAVRRQQITLSWSNWVFSTPIVASTKKEMRKQMADFRFALSQPAWGPGRLDAFTAIRVSSMLLDMDYEHSVATADIPHVWKMDPKHDRHWDGNNVDDLREPVVSAALASGVSRESVTENLAKLTAIQQFLQERLPPPYPFAYDRGLAQEKGQPLFEKHCAECHAVDGQRTGRVIPLSELGTNGARLASWTQEAADKYNTEFTKGYSWQFRHFKGVPKTTGYVAVPLEGIWLRAPYLHNGSVPTLWDLLKAPEDRPTMFYRGYDVYDQTNVGFIADVPEENGRSFFRFNTRERGNGNDGHRWGTALSPEEKKALLEYLKTL